MTLKLRALFGASAVGAVPRGRGTGGARGSASLVQGKKRKILYYSSDSVSDSDHLRAPTRPHYGFSTIYRPVRCKSYCHDDEAAGAVNHDVMRRLGLTGASLLVVRPLAEAATRALRRCASVCEDDSAVFVRLGSICSLEA